uniref:Uncharacterized protein n=1 Tax=Peronospora matthiolae TaxID=2874970 RepID=A0AAV1UB01_9STRA
MIAAAAQRLRSSSMHTLKTYDKSEHRLLVVGGSGLWVATSCNAPCKRGSRCAVSTAQANRSGRTCRGLTKVDWRSGSVFNEEDPAEAALTVSLVSVRVQ